MKNDINKKEGFQLTKYPLPKRNKSNELYGTISSKLSWVSKDYWKVINQESKSDEKLTEQDIYEANLSDIEQRFEKNSIAYQIFETLKRQGLKIFINPKTDISYTKGYNIIWGLGAPTEQSKKTMEINPTASDNEVYIQKLIHEMGHSLTEYIGDEMQKLFELIFNTRQYTGLHFTKLGDLDRYDNLNKKSTEDTVEFIRMYIKDPNQFKTYLQKIFEKSDFQGKEAFLMQLFNLTKNCVEKATSKQEQPSVEF